MRTTLKRGIGRVSAANGNGSGNGHAVLPPGVLTPMRRYRQPPPPGRTWVQWTAAAFGWLLVVVATVGAGLLGGAYLYTHDFLSKTSGHTSKDVKIAASRLDLAVPGKPAIAMVLGYDHRPFGPEKNLPSRSDTIMLLRADPATDTISMLSFPRDLVVPIYCKPGVVVAHDRINGAFEQCGSRGTLETVKALTGLPINYLITVNFIGFRRIVNTVGGVWIDVDRRYLNTNAGASPGLTYTPIDLKPGYQRLDGRQALRFARFRHTDSDLYRIARQQQVVRSLKEQVANHFSVFDIPKIVNAVRDNVEVGVAGGGVLDFQTLKNYAFFGFRLPPGHFFQAKIEGLTGYNELAASPQSIHDAVDRLTHQDVAAPQKAAASALGKKLRTTRVKPTDVSLVVLNGTTVAGLAADTSYKLAQRGYRTVSTPNGATPNAPSSDYLRSSVYYDPALPNARAAARQLSAVLGGAGVAPIPAEIRPLVGRGTTLAVVLGASFHGDLAAEAVDQTPKHASPSVVSNPGASLDLVRRVARRVPFRLEYPRLLERSSRPDYELPVRAYTISRGHRAVRLVYKTGVVEYWGIEETDWADAPVLKEANDHRTIGGRHFDLYFTGAHLHMVVLRENGATYWVTNTLLDTLSNETMLAIAKGLHPLGK
jgi:LCP family protein required for cell wall assembly